MLDSGIGENVNVIIQTMGTKQWQDYGISGKTAQTYQVKKGKLKKVRGDLGQLDCTSKDTLSEFIEYGKTAYPAERYLFIFWNHGGGPVYGFGKDEWQDEQESLTLAEMSQAFEENDDIYFDMIGMDCCIMGNLETCYALSPYCRYSLLSEDLWDGWGDYEEEYGANSSGNGIGEYAYDYDTGDFVGGEEDPFDDWIYDSEEDIWYTYEDDILYLYDEESDTICYYDEDEDEIYYYDEADDEWYLMEE